MIKTYRFFDNASTTPCCEEAVALLTRFATIDYGNPSSSHALGLVSSQAIREARLFFSDHFNIQPEQVIFTGSGTEADNLAILGPSMASFLKKRKQFERERALQLPTPPLPRIIISATEHPAVKKAAFSLSLFDFDIQVAPVDSNGQIVIDSLIKLLTPETFLISIHQVNNITGSLLPVEALAKLTKKHVPNSIFHTDAVQSFGKTPVPTFPSAVDLVSISGHKIKGPKGVGALLILNPKLLKSVIRPLNFGGEQESGYRPGTQNAGLIAGLHVAAKKILKEQNSTFEYITKLRKRLLDQLIENNLLSPHSILHWNSPQDLALTLPHIVNLSAKGLPSTPLVNLLEERGFIVSAGSACHSHKAEPDPVLEAMGLPYDLQTSALRISFSPEIQLEDTDALVRALRETLSQLKNIQKGNNYS